MGKLNDSITCLNRGVSKYGPAPHKPILLLAVIESFHYGEIITNWIEPKGELLVHFRNLWDQLVHTGHTPNFSLPFFHLKNEKGKFWELITFPGKNLPVTNSNSIKSYRALVNCVAAAKLSEEFFLQLMDPMQREILRQNILSAYFPKHINAELSQAPAASQEIQNEILFDPAHNYVRKVKRIIKEKSKAEVEEELALRSHMFRKGVKQHYKHQCAITGLRIQFSLSVSMVDACHIIPFAETHDDTITNGIALSPTIHRAFDSGLISISDDYTVLVHKKVQDHSHNIAFQQLHNKQVFLPEQEAFFPSLERLKQHRKKFNF